jgi:hypothetical protein
MKAKIRIISFLILLTTACKKEDDQNNVFQPTSADNYTSISDFYARNGAALQTFVINAETGGGFTTPKGTTVQIPANAFKTMGGGNVTGNVTIEFKDIYKKSDMLLSDKPTVTIWGTLLKSAGEFFIKAVQNNEPLKIAELKKIDVLQPAENGIADDTAMAAFVQGLDSMGLIAGWQEVLFDTVGLNASEYVFSLYTFSNPEDSGTWCNSDNPTYFSAYPAAELTLHGLDNADSNFTDAFLIFNGVNSMVHVYRDWGTNNFIYPYAPTGLSCTVVAIGVKDGKLKSSFTPITIANNQVVDFSLTETTTDEFKEELNALN